MEKECTYSDKNSEYRGTYKDGVFTIWNSRIKKAEYSFSIPLEKLRSYLNLNGNANYAVRELVKDAMYKAQDEWVANTKDETLRKTRWEYMYNNSIFGRVGSLDSLAIDGACRVLMELHNKAFGEYPKSWVERIKANTFTLNPDILEAIDHGD